jgi:hypothetical protein
MWEWIKQAAQKSLEFGAQYLINQTFIEQLLTLPCEQALQELQAKVNTMDDQAYQGFIASLTIMINTLQQNIQQTESSTPFGSSYEDQLAYYAAGVQSGMGTQQSQVSQQYQQRLQGLQVIALYAAQFRAQMPIGQASDSSSPESLEQRFMTGLEQGADQQTLLDILDELEKVAPDKAKKLSRLYAERNSPIRNLR